MQLSCDLLIEHAELSLAQIAEQVGYQSEWAYAKAFKRRFGIGPGAWRRAHRRA